MALERISSPEQLDQLLRVTTPKTWLALLALIAFLLVTGAWGYWGRLTTRVSGQGMLIRSDERMAVVLYVPAERATELRPGMDAEITPIALRREEYGFILGKVAFVGDDSTPDAAVMQVLQNPQLVRVVSGAGPVTEVRVDIAADAATPSGYRWSSGRGAPVRLTAGMRCRGDIVTRTQKPLSFVIPNVESPVGLR